MGQLADNNFKSFLMLMRSLFEDPLLLIGHT